MPDLEPRERVARCLRFEEPDRVTVSDTLLPGFSKVYRRSRGLSPSVDLRDHFRFDIRNVSCMFTPSLIKQQVLEREGDLEIAMDGWGLVTRRWVRMDGVPQVLKPAIHEREELDTYFHDPDDEVRYSGLGDSVNAIHKNGLAAFFTISDHWGGLYHIFGLKNLLRLIHEKPRLIRDTVNRLSRHYNRIIANVLDYEIDAIWVFGDLSTNAGPFISPQRYRRLFSSAHRSMFRPVRKRGIPVIFHSDGDIRLLIPHMIDEGVSAIQPLDALAGMNVLDMKELYGDRLAFMGNIPNKTILPRGTPREVAEEVRKKIVAGEGGGYILGSSHSIAQDIPPENFEAMLEAGRKYGKYPLERHVGNTSKKELVGP